MNPDEWNEDYEPPVPDVDLATGTPRPLFYVGLIGGAALLAGGIAWLAEALSRSR